MDIESKPKYRDILEYLEAAAMQWNYQLLYISKKSSLVLPTDFYKKNEKSISMLEREGAVHVRFGQLGAPFQYNMCWLEITKFGYDFVWACEGK